MVEKSLARTARALDLIPYVLEHQGIEIGVLAEKFGVSQNQIYEDLNLLFCCGLPGYTPLELIDIQFEEGIVTVSDPQILDQPRNFTKVELISILLALDVLQSIAPKGLQEKITSLSDRLNRLSSKAELPYVVDAPMNEFMQDIQVALEKGINLRIEYVSAKSDSVEKRDISPITLISSGDHSYLTAWCSSARAERTFRVDRIRSLDFLKNSQLVINESSETTFDEAVVYTLEVSRTAKRFIEEHQDFISSSRKNGDGTIVEISNIQEDWLIRTVRTYLGEIQIISPESVKNAYLARFEGILNRYSEN